MASEREAQVVALLEEYFRRWEAMEFEKVQALWEQDYHNIIYVPEEMTEPIRDWAGVEAYFRDLVGFVDRVKAMQLSELSLDVFGEVAYAFCKFHFEGDIKDRTEPYSIDGRITFILRRKGGEWGIVHYHESCPHVWR